MQENSGKSFLTHRSINQQQPLSGIPRFVKSPCMQGLSPTLLALARNIPALLLDGDCRLRFDTYSRQRSILYSVSAAFMSRDVDVQTCLDADEHTQCRVFASNPQPHNV